MRWSTCAAETTGAIFCRNLVGALSFESRFVLDRRASVCAERELACDDRVLQSSCTRKAYAMCLTRLAEDSVLRRKLTLALGAWERRSELVSRVQRLLMPLDNRWEVRQAKLVTGSLIARGYIGRRAGVWLAVPSLSGSQAFNHSGGVSDLSSARDQSAYSWDARVEYGWNRWFGAVGEGGDAAEARSRNTEVEARACTRSEACHEAANCTG
jgi:hypothetical protein